ncbi:MAG: hypothetical protein H0U40_02120 [Chloroflexia bacterium]|nr:hypothetical protein [Chloroflexia bacterium]
MVEIDWLMLADSAGVVANTRSMPGGGRDPVTVHDAFPAVHPCAVAAVFRVPWEATDRARAIEIEDEDGDTRAKVTSQVAPGRPPSLAHGLAQRVQFAVHPSLRLNGPGHQGVIGRIDGVEAKRVLFTVVGGPAVRPRPNGRPVSG